MARKTERFTFAGPGYAEYFLNALRTNRANEFGPVRMRRPTADDMSEVEVTTVPSKMARVEKCAHFYRGFMQA